MAATTYYMFCDSANMIVSFKLEDDFSDVGVPGTSRSASFSEDAGDSPDVQRASPLIGDYYEFNDPTHTYTPAASLKLAPRLAVDGWSGDGAVDPDDGVYEMTSNGVNSATLTVRKRTLTNDVTEGQNDAFCVCILGSANAPVGRITLDANSEATITFTPAATEKGMVEITLVPINVDYPTDKAKIRFI